MTAALQRNHFLLHALGAFVLAAGFALAWTSAAQAAGHSASAPAAATDGGPGKDKGKCKGKKCKGKGGSTPSAGTGDGGGDDGGDTGVAPSPTPPPSTGGSDGGTTTPDPSTPDPGPSAPDPGPSAPEPGPSAPDPGPSTPDPSSPPSDGTSTPDPGTTSPDPSAPDPDPVPHAPAPVVGSTSGSGSSAPAPASPSSPTRSPSAPSAPAPTIAALPVFRAPQPAATGSISPQDARARGGDLQRSWTHLLFRFKRLLHSWRGNHAGLTLLRDGVGGTLAVLVSLVGRAPTFAIYTPHAVATHAAGVKYRLNAWLRSAHPGTTLCLRVQEVAAQHRIVRTTENCISTGARWQHFRLSAKSLGAGHKLRFSIYELDAVTGDSFEVGGLAAGRVKR